MNITPAINVSVPTVVNPQTDTLRRENNQREVIAKPAAASQSAAEKGVASERDRGKSPAQNNEQFDFASIRKQAELANSEIAEQGGERDSQQESPENPQQAKKSIENNDSAEQEKSAADEESSHGDAAAEFSDQQEIKGLQQRDREVRSHELAHASAGGATTGAPSYSFQVGPDGKKYAVEGEVSVDLSPVEGNPRATIAKMQKVYNAALAPADPSIQDTRVANSAAQLIAQAQSELLSVELDESSKAGQSGPVIKSNDSFSGRSNESLDQDGSDFDSLVNHTLQSQEEIAPSRSSDIDARAGRIENFYSNINQAYEKPPKFQFELTA